MKEDGSIIHSSNIKNYKDKRLPLSPLRCKTYGGNSDRAIATKYHFQRKSNCDA